MKMLSISCFCWFLNLRVYFIYLCCYLLLVVAAASRVVHGLTCYCNPRECDVLRARDCPGKGILLLDPCKCCRVCAKTLGEICGGPGDFSGQCEPPLQCVATLPFTSGLGVCRNLPHPPFLPAYHRLNKRKHHRNRKHHHHHKRKHHYKHNYGYNCTKEEDTIIHESGCEITNKRCQCWPTMRLCKYYDGGEMTTTDTRWHFKTFEECLQNLQDLIKIEMEFDEDYTVSPDIFTYKKFRRKRRSLKVKIIPSPDDSISFENNAIVN